MEAAIKNPAVEWMIQEKKSIEIDVTDYISKTYFYNYNRSRVGSESFQTTLDLDWDKYYLEISVAVDFKFQSLHQCSTFENPQEEEFEITSQSVDVTILQFAEWNEETEEHVDVILPCGIYTEICRHLESTTILSE